MPRATSSSFVTVVELAATGAQAKKLRSKFEAARQVYNACLGEALKRLRLMREARAWQRAGQMPKGKERTTVYRELQQQFGFREYDLHKWCTQFTRSWINEHIGSKTVNAIASRAFKAAEEFLYAAGKRRPPRFRRRGELRSVEGKAGSCCHWKGDHIAWKGVSVPAIIEDDTDEVLKHGLQSRVKYVRMVRKIIRGKERFYAQLVCEGTAFCKPSHKPRRGRVGIDIGTQTIAVVGGKRAYLGVFCDGLERNDTKIRRIQRAMDRSRRACNPDNFDEEGRIRSQGNQRLKWVESKRYLQLRKRLREMLRQEAEFRKNLHGQLVAQVLTFGDDIWLENINYQSWAKRKTQKATGHRKKSYGRSVSRRAPGFFEQRLISEAEKWGASVTRFPTKTTKLSQTCHCGHVEKKKLHVRWHRCKQCGAVGQRDLYSAFLAQFVEGNRLKADQAQKAWPSSCAALEAALSDIKHASGMPSSLGLRSRDRAARLQNCGQTAGKIVDVVPAEKSDRESHKEPVENHNNTIFSRPETHLSQDSTGSSDMSGVDSG